MILMIIRILLSQPGKAASLRIGHQFLMHSPLNSFGYWTLNKYYYYYYYQSLFMTFIIFSQVVVASLIDTVYG